MYKSKLRLDPAALLHLCRYGNLMFSTVIPRDGARDSGPSAVSSVALAIRAAATQKASYALTLFRCCHATRRSGRWGIRSTLQSIRSSSASEARWSESSPRSTARLRTDKTSTSNNSGASSVASSRMSTNFSPNGVRSRYSVAADASMT